MDVDEFKQLGEIRLEIIETPGGENAIALSCVSCGAAMGGRHRVGWPPGTVLSAIVLAAQRHKCDSASQPPPAP